MLLLICLSPRGILLRTFSHLLDFPLLWEYVLRFSVLTLGWLSQSLFHAVVVVVFFSLLWFEDQHLWRGWLLFFSSPVGLLQDISLNWHIKSWKTVMSVYPHPTQPLFCGWHRGPWKLGACVIFFPWASSCYYILLFQENGHWLTFWGYLQKKKISHIA